MLVWPSIEAGFSERLDMAVRMGMDPQIRAVLQWMPAVARQPLGKGGSGTGASRQGVGGRHPVPGSVFRAAFAEPSATRTKGERVGCARGLDEEGGAQYHAGR